MQTLKAWLRRHWAVLLVVALGFGLRLWLSSGRGFDGDVWCFQVWAKSAVKLGVARAYGQVVEDAMLPNYPPLSMLILEATGYAYQTFFSAMYASHKPVYKIVIRLPALFADIATALLVYRLLRRQGVRYPTLGVVLYLLHPAAFYDTAVWGQMDSVYTGFALGGFVAFFERRFALFGALLACAALIKAQTIVFLPLAAVLMLTVGRRHLFRATLAGLAVVGAVITPFALGNALLAVKGSYIGAVGFYPTLSSNAYNLWWALFGHRADGGVKDTEIFWGITTYRNVGWALWGSTVAFVLAHVVHRFRKQKELEPIFVLFAASVCAHAFFALNTEMHERYLFPLVPFGLPVAIVWRRYRGPYALATLLYFVNMVGVLSWTPVDAKLFETFPMFSVFVATLQTACFFVTLQRFAEYARGRETSPTAAPAVRTEASPALGTNEGLLTPS